MELKSLECEGFSVINKSGIPLICDDRLLSLGVPHGFTTRHGGVSEGEFASLNLAWSETRSDTKESVDQNYDILLSAFGVSRDDAVRTNQTHTNVTRYVTRADGGTGLSRPDFSEGVDGLITDEKNLLIMARMADCLPILIYDTKKRAVGAVHSGWKGTMELIAPLAVADMQRRFGCKPNELFISFGPSVGQCCYRVGEEFRDNFISRHGTLLEAAFRYTTDGLYADMRTINRILLERCGVKRENISIYTPCTCCTPEHFFSYRRQKDQRGTMSAVIMLPGKNQEEQV